MADGSINSVMNFSMRQAKSRQLRRHRRARCNGQDR
jgi:hypothetical protein